MGRRSHFLTPYIVVLHTDKKANKSNKYAVCRACISIIGKDEAYKLRFTNTKKECARHIKNCQNFAQKYSPQQITKLLDDAAKDGVKSKPPQKRCHTESSSESPDDDNDDSILEQNKNNNNLEETSNSDGITLDNYIFRPLTIIQEQKLEQLLLDVTVSCGLAFRWIEDPAVKNATDKVSTKLLDNTKDDLFGVTLAFDGWKNVARQHIFGIVLITSTGEMIIWKAINCGGNRGTANEIIRITQQLFAELNQENIKVNGLVTDSASENASARKQLQLLYRDKLFLPCFAHQINLCVGNIFKESNSLTKVGEQAVEIASFFNRAKVWIGKLREEQAAIYKNKYYTLMVPNDNRWNSQYYCFASLLRSKSALKNLATKIEEQESDDLYDFPEEYLNCISDNNWWKKLKELETLILPYCAALNQLQRHNSQLHDVLHCFGNLVIVLRSFDNNNFKNKLLKKLEKRWSDWEQPLLLLAFLLHPGYRTDKFNPQIETLSFPHLGKWVIYYYCAWFNEDPMVILVELEAYRQKKYPYNDATARQFNNNVLEFWNYVRGYSKELYRVAERIFSIAVTTASLERLFSTMGWLHSKRRNRLAHKKVLGMTQIRASMQQRLKQKKIDDDALKF
ncbi:hypothetical protein RclHR1_11130001 [Rhizophagus clarus]|uniref:DUF659 domain-containing protein n=1 Tax=Rhizophagus clarus TaxID=94130 RepID=A0A2Z6QIF9_9GLOM|nr:hypothetical protein RclHR1_11130001 [Rhizophagus clarus]